MHRNKGTNNNSKKKQINCSNNAPAVLNILVNLFSCLQESFFNIFSSILAKKLILQKPQYNITHYQFSSYT